MQSFLPKSDEEGEYYQSLHDYKTRLPEKNERMIDALSDIVNCISSKENPLSGGTNSIMVHKIVNSIKSSSNSDNMKVCFDE
jgi:hypothetical protein